MRSIKENTKIPVMGHADGVCAVFVDETAREGTALRVVLESKVCISFLYGLSASCWIRTGQVERRIKGDVEI